MPSLRTLALRARGLLPVAAAAFWDWLRQAFRWTLEWATEKTFGDAAYKRLSDTVSAAMTDTWWPVILDWGPRLALLGLGFVLLLRPEHARLPSLSSMRAKFGKSSLKPEVVAPAAPASRVEALPVLARPKPAVAAVDSNEEPELEWDKLYQRSEDGRFLHLRFLPDTRDSSTDTLLLIVYGYKMLYGYGTVRCAAAHSELRRVQREAPNAKTINQIMGIYSVAAVLNEPDYGADAIRGGLLRRVKLSEGGSYELTTSGIYSARRTAQDLIWRA